MKITILQKKVFICLKGGYFCVKQQILQTKQSFLLKITKERTDNSCLKIKKGEWELFLRKK